MIDAEKWFDDMRNDIERAQKSFKGGYYASTHFFLGRLVGDVRVLRDLMDEKKWESDESSGET